MRRIIFSMLFLLVAGVCYSQTAPKGMTGPKWQIVPVTYTYSYEYSSSKEGHLDVKSFVLLNTETGDSFLYVMAKGSDGIIIEGYRKIGDAVAKDIKIRDAINGGQK